MEQPITMAISLMYSIPSCPWGIGPTNLSFPTTSAMWNTDRNNTASNVSQATTIIFNRHQLIAATGPLQTTTVLLNNLQINT